MPRHVQTSDRTRRRAGFWLTLVVTLGALPLRAQQAPTPTLTPESDTKAAATDPVDLAADHILVWESNGIRWVVLNGKAAVLQGVEGLRAESAVVKLGTVSHPGGRSFRVEVYAEGKVQAIGRSGPPQGALWGVFVTTNDVRLKPYSANRITRLNGPPRGLAIVQRGFPAEATPKAGPSKPPQPGSRASAGTPSRRGPVARANAVVPSTLKVAGPRDAAVTRAQLAPESPPAPIAVPGNPAQAPPVIDLPPIEAAPTVPDLSPRPEPPPTEAVPLPGPDNQPAPPQRGERRPPPPPPVAPMLPGSQRVTRIWPRTGGPNFTFQQLPTTKEGVSIFIIRGGVNIVADSPPPRGTIDLSADSVILWRYEDPKNPAARDAEGKIVEDVHAPMEVYLEGNVVVRQDNRTLAGTSDQKLFLAKQAYYDFRTDRLISLDSEINVFAPGLVAPMKVTAPRIEQFRPVITGPDGKLIYGPEQIRAENTLMTGSRFPRPGYRITNRSIDLTKIADARTEPNSGKTIGDPRDPNDQETVWRYDARQNFFFLGAVPFFYSPRIVGESDDLEPALRNISFRTNNYFGQQVLTGWNGFRLFGIDKPKWIDIWNVDLDYLSARTKKFPALGTEVGWFGEDLLNDLIDPYRRDRGRSPSITSSYTGYFNIWGLQDYGVDDLGSGPAIVTNKLFLANGELAGKAGFQRGPNDVPGVPHLGVPPFQLDRGRLTFRHMQYFLPDNEETRLEDFRLQLEVGYLSDRYFLEEYFKRLFDVGLDQETLAYLIRQRQNTAWSIWTEANLQNWYTDTQWLPRLDYYRLGDSLLNNWFTYSTHSGVDYANVHTASEVNNPNIFAFMPYDPISNTSGSWTSGRGYTNHELDLPLKFDILRVVPYVQGQAVGWTNQINGQSVGRIWGAAGVRADIMAWKAYPTVQSELFNVHGLNHKINFDADYRDAWSNVRLNQIGIQDDLDDNTYESVRRYLALTTYVGGVLPNQYDPRHLILRRALSPITGPSDVQASIETLQLGIHQRLQTKRGPEGRRRIMDWMTLDLTTTYFPYAARDNFNKPFGQNMYNWWWFLGDRTAFYSYGWFEFWDITGLQNQKAIVPRHNNPFGLNVVTSGVTIARPPRANVNIGYTVIDTGPMNTSALNTSVNYWLSPKWYGTYSNMYDFGNRILLNSSFSVTRIGADWLTTIGLVVDPQRNSYMAAIQIAPRISPNIRLGSGTGVNQLDTRFAPTQ